MAESLARWLSGWEVMGEARRVRVKAVEMMVRRFIFVLGTWSGVSHVSEIEHFIAR